MSRQLATRDCERRGQAASEELDGIALDGLAELLLALEHRPRRCAEGTVIEMNHARVEQEVASQVLRSPHGASVIARRGLVQPRCDELRLQLPDVAGEIFFFAAQALVELGELGRACLDAVLAESERPFELDLPSLDALLALLELAHSLLDRALHLGELPLTTLDVRGTCVHESLGTAEGPFPPDDVCLAPDHLRLGWCQPWRAGRRRSKRRSLRRSELAWAGLERRLRRRLGEALGWRDALGRPEDLDPQQ